MESGQLSRYSDRLRAGRPEFDSRQYNIFLFSTASRPTVGPTQPSIQWVPGALSPGLKRQEREAHQSPPSSAEVRWWSYTSTPRYVFMEYCLIN
jgi:hypothetical protein